MKQIPCSNYVQKKISIAKRQKQSNLLNLALLTLIQKKVATDSVELSIAIPLQAVLIIIICKYDIIRISLVLVNYIF